MTRTISKPALDLTPPASCPVGRPGMACSMPQMVTYLLRGSLVKHGLSDDDSRKVVVTPDVGDEAHPALFEVRVALPDGTDRQLLRIEDEDHLNRVINRATTCGYLVADIHAALEGCR